MLLVWMEEPCISRLGSSARENLSGPMHIGCKINREKRFPGCVLDSIKIRILQLIRATPRHSTGEAIASRGGSLHGLAPHDHYDLPRN